MQQVLLIDRRANTIEYSGVIATLHNERYMGVGFLNGRVDANSILDRFWFPSKEALLQAASKYNISDIQHNKYLIAQNHEIIHTKHYYMPEFYWLKCGLPVFKSRREAIAFLKRIIHKPRIINA